MPVEVKAPSFPESVEEGTLMTWYKGEGDAVRRDEKLADIETDKVVLEVAAQQNGVLTRISAREGDTVTSEQVIGVLDPAAKEAAEPAPAEVESVPPAPSPSEPTPAAESPPAPAISAAARQLAEEQGIDLSQLKGSGKEGRITKADVADYLQATDDAPPTEPAEPRTPAVPVATDTGRGEQRVPMTRLRARVAERLKGVQQTAAILTTFNEVNMQPIMELRQRYRDKFERDHGVKLGFMSFFVKAAVEALKQFPIVNASVDETDILYHEYYDIGIAISAPRGLAVPILRDANVLTFAEIERGIVDFAERAKEGQLTLEELTGGTFTITNGGVFGSMLSTPILNPPQSAILGMHSITPRPVAEDDQVVIRPMMYLALSYDHRIIDGRDAVLFLVAIKEFLQNPGRMLLRI